VKNATVFSTKSSNEGVGTGFSGISGRKNGVYIKSISMCVINALDSKTIIKKMGEKWSEILVQKKLKQW
jgi:hypothetical protein